MIVLGEREQVLDLVIVDWS